MVLHVVLTPWTLIGREWINSARVWNTRFWLAVWWSNQLYYWTLSKNFRKKIYFNLIYKIMHPSDQPVLNFAKRPNVQCQLSRIWNQWTLVMRKRSQNHFRFHFTSKTPYSSDTRGILSTHACDVHGQLKITTSKAIRKIRLISWQTIMTKNIIQRNIKRTIFYLRRRVLRVKCSWISWVTNKTLQIS